MRNTSSRFITSILVSSIVLSIAKPTVGGDRPRLQLSACAKPPMIDGLLTDECWKTAATVERMNILFIYVKRTEKTVTEDTQAKVTVDAEWLYFAFRCTHPNPTTMEQTVTDHDGAFFRDDCVEVFLKPRSANNLYYHFALTFAGVRGDREVTDGKGRDPSWYLPWRSATQRTETGWNAELAIPLYILDAGQGLSGLKANLGRTMVVSEFNEGMIKMGVKQHYSCWAPVKRSFHDFANYGVLTGLEALKPRVPFLPAIEKAECGPYALRDSRYFYDVSVAAKGYTDRAGKVLITVLDKPSSGRGAKVSQEVELTGKASQTIGLTVPVKSLCEREVEVTMTDAETGVPLGSAAAENASRLRVMPPPLLDRDYYTSEGFAIVSCRIGLPEELLERFSLIARTADAKRTLARLDRVQPKTSLKLPLAAMPNGTHELVINLKLDDATLVAHKLTLVKKEPRPGREVKIDPTRRIIVKDGKPFFPMGFCFACRMPSEYEKELKKLADGGFNTVIYWNYYCKDPKEAGEFMKLAQKHSIAVVANPSELGKRRLISMKDGFKKARTSHIPTAEKRRMFVEAVNENLPAAEEAVKYVREYPNLLGYYSIDEPHPPVFHIVIEGCKILYDTYSRLDGYRPIWLLYGSGGFIVDLQKGTAYCEVVGVDPYWTPQNGSSVYGTPNVVSMCTAKMAKRGEAVHKPIWVIPMAEIYSGTYKRVTLPEEQRVQTYLALIHGAKGLTYFTYPVLHPSSWKEFCSLAREVSQLAPALLTGELEQKIDYVPGGADIVGGTCPEVQALLLRNPAGGYTLIAANSRRYPVDVTYTVSGLGKGGNVQQRFSGAAHDVRDDAFSDRLEAYETRAYVIRPKQSLPEPVAMKVSMKAYPKQERREVFIPMSGREGKKNLVQNPGFEQATLPNWPDYYAPCMVAPQVGGPDEGDWGLDTRDPYDGKYCLRMKSILRKPKSLRSGFICKLRPKIQPGEKYVWSVYLRADREGLPANLGIYGKRLKLTTSWQRYSAPCRGDLWLLTWGEGTAWADAVQCEKGETPTEFEP